MAVAAAAAAAAANAFQQSLVASNVTPGYLQFPVSYRFFINIIVTFTARSQLKKISAFNDEKVLMVDCELENKSFTV